MTAAVRIAVGVGLFVVLAALAWWLEHRRRNDAPTRARGDFPAQLDRHDFARPDASWLVVLFTSKNCDSCGGLYEKAASLESDEVAVSEVEYFANPELHERYHIDAAPMSLVADAEGVVRASMLGAFAAGDLWSVVAEVRAEE